METWGNKVKKALSRLDKVNNYLYTKPEQEWTHQDKALAISFLRKAKVAENMKDLKKVQEFFSKPLEEVTNDYSPLSYATLVAKGKMDIEDAMKETGFSYVLLKQLVDKVKGVAQSIREQEDPTDIIAMDVPLFIRMLEYAREDAEQDIDLHKVTERAIEAVKLRGLLSMEDYQDIVGEPIDEMTGYSKYLATPENPKGKTQGLTQDVMDKILLKIATMGDDDVEETTRLGEGVIYEELCPKGKAYIKKRQAAGEKSSAYLSGRAVKVCKGQMKG
jgi:hypothetical protein